MASNPDPAEAFRVTPGEANYIKLSRLLLLGGATIIRELFDSQVPPANLAAQLQVLRSTRPMSFWTRTEKKVLFPPPDIAVSSKSFDILLLCKLLREIGNLPPHRWDQPLDPSDHSLAAEIRRVKNYRNQLAHHETRELDDNEFNTYWNEIKALLLRIVRLTPPPPPGERVRKWETAIDKLIETDRKCARQLLNVKVMADSLQSETSQGTLITIPITCDAVQNKKEKSVIIKNVCSSICALLNSHGGDVKLSSSQNLNPILDELVRGIEQRLIMFLGLTSAIELLSVDTKDCGREIIFSIKPSNRIVTMGYNLCLPMDSQVKQVPGIEPLEGVADLLKPGPLIKSNLQEYVKEFQKDAPVPDELRESKTVQFKKIKSDRNKNKTLADRIIANKITHYVSAFANHKGGHVYIGIDDETYKVCGESVDDKEKKRISEKVESAIKAMLWPADHGKPKRGKHWDVSFIPVLNSNREEIPGLFIIVISIARCPGGVFLSLPESYVIENTEVVSMNLEQWKKKVLHDAHMRDIVKFCRENSWKETKALSMPNPGDKSIPEAEHSDSSKAEEDSQRTHPIECETIPRTMSRIVPRNSKSRHLCLRVTDIMEELIQDGNFAKVQQFASKACLKSKAFQKPDIEVAVRLMLALGAYRRRSFDEAYDELSQAGNLISATENAMEFEIQRLHLLACFRRGEGQYEKSYEVTCGGLQEIEGISPGWHSAWVLSDAGYLFSILAEAERSEEVRHSLRQQAVKLYTRAIEHTAKFDKDSSEKSKVGTAKSNLFHRCHLRLAMLSLGCAPVAEVDDENHNVTDEHVSNAIASILVVEESTLKGDSLTDVNKCYLYLVKSDLNYRRSQKNVEQCERYHKKAVEWATTASELAEKDNFPGILKYAKSRLDRLSKVKCYSGAEEELFAELDNYQD